MVLTFYLLLLCVYNEWMRFPKACEGKQRINCGKSVLSFQLYVGSSNQIQSLPVTLSRQELCHWALWVGLCWFGILFVGFFLGKTQFLSMPCPCLEFSLCLASLTLLLPLRSWLKCAVWKNAFLSLPRRVALGQSSHRLKWHTHLQKSLPPASPIGLCMQKALFSSWIILLFCL